MFGGVLGAQVIGIFDIEKNMEMAFFIPLITAMGGNVGVQSSALVVQSLSNNSIGFDSLFQKMLKELMVALANGLVCSLLIFGAGIALGYNPLLSLTVAIALLSVVLFASLFGTFVPLALNKYKIDPALATGPFITTANDVLGLFIYFYIGKMIFGY
jgi:magnesium transporter